MRKTEKRFCGEVESYAAQSAKVASVCLAPFEFWNLSSSEHSEVRVRVDSCNCVVGTSDIIYLIDVLENLNSFILPQCSDMSREMTFRENRGMALRLPYSAPKPRSQTQTGF